MASFQNRVIGALTLQASTYEEVENDASATSQAAIIVVAAALLGSLGSLIYGFGMMVILGPVFALIGWVIGSFVVMFVGMRWWSQQIYPVAYQWRRVATAAGAGVALVAIGKLAGGGLPVALLLALLDPVALFPLGFYLPSERRAIGARLRLARS